MYFIRLRLPATNVVESTKERNGALGNAPPTHGIPAGIEEGRPSGHRNCRTVHDVPTREEWDEWTLGREAAPGISSATQVTASAREEEQRDVRLRCRTRDERV
jgi:hypothetical protein